MLYYKFKNYEEFKDMFGIIKHGNGVYAAEKTRYCWHISGTRDYCMKQ